MKVANGLGCFLSLIAVFGNLSASALATPCEDQCWVDYYQDIRDICDPEYNDRIDEIREDYDTRLADCAAGLLAALAICGNVPPCQAAAHAASLECIESAGEIADDEQQDAYEAYIACQADQADKRELCLQGCGPIAAHVPFASDSVRTIVMLVPHTTAI